MDLIGTQIGSYVVERQLGAGGAGTVYACRHTLIDREVAVKVLHDEHVRDPDQVARFFQEAKAAADIGHPNIITIIDYGTLAIDGGTRTYVMMESLEGESLDKRLRRGGLSSDDIIHILSQIASALIACHGKGIVHRDLKPSNVFLCNRSFDPLFVKVLDFGTAKLTAPTPGMRRTQYGVVIGTPAYMSPEQCEGRGAIDHRSDIYSIGVMLYEMLTGTLPFGGAMGDILLGHMTRVPEPPRARNPSIPVEWEDLCLRMMEKARENRFQSITQLAAALADLRGHAIAYEAARTERAAGGHSGHTLVSGAANEGRATLRVDVGAALAAVTGSTGSTGATAAVSPLPSLPPVPPPLTPPPSLPPTPTATATPPPMTAFDPHSACAVLLADPRYAAFARTLMARPTGCWFDVTELCQAAGVAAPAGLPAELGLFATWIEHPYPEPSLAAVAFLSLRTGWNTIVLCPRRW